MGFKTRASLKTQKIICYMIGGLKRQEPSKKHVCNVKTII